MSTSLTEKVEKLNINSISNQIDNERKFESFVMDEITNENNTRKKTAPREKKVSFSRFKQIQSNNLSISNYPLEDEIILIHDNEWSQMDENEKITYIVFSILKFFLISLFVYALMVSYRLLSIGIVLLSSLELKSSSIIHYISSNSLNSFAISIMLSALLQNSTIALSILMTITSSGILDMNYFAPSCMGCYLGALIKNLIISSSFQSIYEFRRSFRAAALNQGFHLITTFFLLPLEIFFGFMQRLSRVFIETSKIFQIDLFNDLIDQLVESLIIVEANAIKRCCYIQFNKHLNDNSTASFEQNKLKECSKKCNYLCLPMIKHFGDVKSGILLSILAIFLLFLCLFVILKLFSSLITGPLAKWVISQLGATVSKKFKWIFHLLLFICSMFLTALLQNSNSFTSTLVNLYQLKVISFQKTYVMTVGSNLGAVFPGYLIAFIQPSACRSRALQLAVINNLYILFGTLLWLPFSNIRLPKMYSVFLTDLISKYKFFFRLYVFILVCLGPLIILGLALFKPYWIGLILVLVIFLFVSITYLLMKSKDKYCPIFLKDFFEKIYYKFSRKSEERQSINISLDNDFIEESSKVDTPCRLLIFFRKLSIMNGIIREGKQFSERNISENSFSNDSSDEETFCDEYESHETNHGMYIFSNSSFRNIRDVTSTPN